MLQFINGGDRLEAHEFDGILVTQVIGSFDRVKGVPFRVVFLFIGKGRANPSWAVPVCDRVG